MTKELIRDIVAVLAIIFALVFSVILFETKSASKASYNSEYFAREDVYDNWVESKAHHIELSECGDTLELEDGGLYELTGKMNGQVYLSGSSQAVYIVRLNGTEIKNENGPAIFIENANKVIIELADGSENTIYMGSESSDEKKDGAIYSKDDLTIRGSGKLNVTGEYSHGIVCNDKLVLSGCEITVEAKEDAIHANDLIAIRAVKLDLTAGDDAMTVKNDKGTGTFYGESGSVIINDCYEGIEGDSVIIEDGTYEIYPTDDGINGMSFVEIRGGNIRIENTKGRDCDGIDSNGDIIISGGEIYISLPAGNMNEPLDGGTESGGKIEVTGGNITAFVGGEEVDAVEMANQGFGGGMRGGFGDKTKEGFNGERPELPDGEFPDKDKTDGKRRFDNDGEKPDTFSFATPNEDMPQER